MSVACFIVVGCCWIQISSLITTKVCFHQPKYNRNQASYQLYIAIGNLQLLSWFGLKFKGAPPPLVGWFTTNDSYQSHIFPGRFFDVVFGISFWQRRQGELNSAHLPPPVEVQRVTTIRDLQHSDLGPVSVISSDILKHGQKFQSCSIIANI